MSKIFYDHLIVIEEVLEVLDTHELNPKERFELLNLIDQTLHHHILDEILALLPKVSHEEFLKKFHENPSDSSLLPFIREKSKTDVDKAIMNRANQTKKDLIKTIKKSKAG